MPKVLKKSRLPFRRPTGAKQCHDVEHVADLKLDEPSSQSQGETVEHQDSVEEKLTVDKSTLCEELEGKILQLQDELKKSEHTMEQLQREVEEQKEAHVKAIAAEVSELRLKLEEGAANEEALHRDLDNQLSHVNDRDHTIEQLQEKLRHLTEIEDSLQEMTKQSLTAQEEVQKKTVELEALKVTLQRCSEAESNLRKELEELQEELLKKVREMNELELSLKQARDSESAQQTTLEQELIEARDQLKKKDVETEQMLAKSDEILRQEAVLRIELEHECTKINEIIHSRDSEIEELRAKLQSVENSLQRELDDKSSCMKDRDSEVELLKSELQQLREVRENLQMQLEDQSLQHQHQMKTQDDEIERLQESLRVMAVVETSVHKLKDELQEACNEKSNLLDECERQNSIIKQLTETETDLRRQLSEQSAAAAADKILHKTEVAEIQCLVTESKVELAELQEETRRQDTEIAELKLSLEQSSSSHDALVSELRDRDCQLQQLQSALSQSGELETALRSELEELDSKYQQLRTSLREVSEAESTVRRELASRSAEVEDNLQVIRQLSLKQNQLSQVEKMLHHELENQKRQTEEEHVKHSREVEELTLTVTLLTETETFLREQLRSQSSASEDEISKRDRELEQLMTRLHQSREVERSLRAKLEAQTSAKLEERRTHAEDVDYLNERLAKSSAELCERDNEIKHLKLTVEQLSTTKANISAELERQQEHVRSETAKHYSEIAQLEHALKCSSEAENTLRKNLDAHLLLSRDENLKKDSIIENLKKLLAQSTARENMLITQQAAMEAEKVKCDIELKQLRLSESDCVRIMNELQAKVESMADERMSYESELNHLRTTAQQQKSEIAALNQQMTTKHR